jgi:hypothetical protein
MKLQYNSISTNQLMLHTYEGSAPTVKSLLSRNYVHHVGPNEL